MEQENCAARKPLPSLQHMLDACAKARAEAMAEIKSNPELRNLRWKVDRAPRLVAIDAKGDRLNDGDWSEWKRRKREVIRMYEINPEAVEIVVESGINLYERPDDVDYVTEFWTATLWENESVDDLVRKHTAFATMDELLQADGGYRPSLDVREPHMLRIANAYDRQQQLRGDPRRAYRYGL